MKLLGSRRSARVYLYGSVAAVLGTLALALSPGKATTLGHPLATALGTNSALAQATAGYPQRLDPTINDYSGILLPADKARLRESLEQLRAATGIEAVVVTVPSTGMYGTGDRSFEVFATSLFNTWGLGDAQRDDGVLVLFSEGDRAVRIELGRGYSRAYDARMQLVIDEYMLPRFRESEYSAGLYNGTQATIQQLTGPPPSTVENLPTQGLAIGAGALFLGGIGLFGLLKRRDFLRPKCSSCDVRMQPLPPESAKAHLSAGQCTELQLGSVRHNVLECPQCRQIVKRQFPNFGLGQKYGACPICHFKTLETVKQTTVVSPTYSSSGEAIAERCCRHCNHTDETTVHLPRLERSSSSHSSSSGGSSSGGGGSSSGGGASGRW
ncbi:MAG: hypothetical protein DCF17_08065 [Shackletoniella antarctica]|uniref:TPM domain-containing protein n=1 Tax=Shackletoniella antarctica TaxID=268115 RepID=A0A2W4YID7_9CYAN|nr:MAG: hypothetical protein DCF17_08065 [Shackletoniella antarctica]